MAVAIVAIGIASTAVGPGTSIHRDQHGPGEPWAWSASHEKGVPSPCRRVLAQWRPSADGTSGVAGYSWSFSRSRLERADEYVDTASTSIRSSRLADGRWWLHVRAVDRAGNASTDAASGPYWIDGRAVVVVNSYFSRQCRTPEGGNAPRYDPEDCLQRPSLDGYKSSRREEYRNPYGYEGLYYSPLTCSNRVRVLRHTVTTTGSGRWRAWGLVRNETLRDVGDVSVRALLYGGDGELVGRVETRLPVAPLRRNEPGPFALDSSFPAERVARIEWEVEANPSSGGSRLLTLGFWKDFVPTVVSGDVRNETAAKGGVPIRRPIITGAWADPAGRIIWVDTTSVRLGRGSDTATLHPGDSASFELVIDDPYARPLLNRMTGGSFYWATGG